MNCPECDSSHPAAKCSGVIKVVHPNFYGERAKDFWVQDFGLYDPILDRIAPGLVDLEGYDYDDLWWEPVTEVRSQLKDMEGRLLR